MTDILAFTGPHQQPTPDDIEQIASWLEEKADEVRSGEITGVVLASIMSEGKIRCGWGMLPGGDSHVLLAAASYLEHDLMHATRDGML